MSTNQHSNIARIDALRARLTARTEIAVAPTASAFPFTFGATDVRVVLDGQSNPWFVAADVAAVLDIADVRTSLRSVDDEDKGRHSVPTLGGAQETITVNESGLYSLVLRSRKPQAKAFKRWITAEVLPAIRKTGTYAVTAPTSTVAVPTNMREALVMALAAVDRADAAEARAVQAEAAVVELAPVAEVAVRVMAATGDYSIRDAAQALSRDHGIATGQRRLLASLRDLRWVGPDGKPYQRRIDSGHLAVKVGTYDHPHTGEPMLSRTTRVTGKGIVALAQALRPAGTDLTAA